MKTMAQIEAEALYFRMYHSYLLQRPSLRDDYDMLKDHYQSHPGCLKKLTKNDLLRIKQVQEDILNNRHSLFTSHLDLNPGLPEALKKEKTDQNHREMCNTIVRNSGRLLEPFTGPISFMNREHPSLFGPIDIVAQSGCCMYVIEAKTKSADHAIVGQIMKYFIGVSLRLSHRFFDEVKMITVCPGYDDPAFKGLKSIGAQTLLISSNLEKTSIIGK